MLEGHLDYLKREPYSLTREEKREFLTGFLQELTVHHREACPEYARILEVLGARGEGKGELEEERGGRQGGDGREQRTARKRAPDESTSCHFSSSSSRFWNLQGLSPREFSGT